jgi:PAS domain S-box-containing protein
MSIQATQGDYLRSLFEQFPVAVLIANDAGRFVDANEAACRLFERRRDELVGSHLSTIVPPGNEESVAAQWLAFLRDGEQSGLFTIALPSGLTRQVHFHARANFVPGLHSSFMDSVAVTSGAAQDGGRVLSMCAWTKRVRVGDEWVSIEEYLSEHHGLRISHGMAPNAFLKLRQELKDS